MIEVGGAVLLALVALAASYGMSRKRAFYDDRLGRDWRQQRESRVDRMARRAEQRRR
jgi:hypothetical protein